MNNSWKKIKERYPDKKFGQVNLVRNPKLADDCENYEIVRDDGQRHSLCSHEWEEHEWVDGGWEINLDHSCDEWVIGSVEDGISFLKDLTCAIHYAESNP